MTQKTNGSKTPGMDDLAFKSIPPAFKFSDIEKAIEYLKPKLKELSSQISLAKGSNDQSIQRKGIEELNSREQLRRHFKSAADGKPYIMGIREELKAIKSDPVVYANQKHEEAKKFNNNLKFGLANYIKNSSL